MTSQEDIESAEAENNVGEPLDISASAPESEVVSLADSAPRTTFRMELSFDGTAYHGWQRQPNGVTVQEVIEEKLYRLFGEREHIRIQGSSRTDAGVHALGMVCSFSAPPSPYIPDWKLK